MQSIEIQETIPYAGDYDIIVIGGGLAGAAAALAGKRQGKTVLLVEKTIALGGLATVGLVNIFMPMCNGRGIVIEKGMAEEFFWLAIKYGYDCLPAAFLRDDPQSKERFFTSFSAPIFSMTLTNLLREAGVEFAFDSVFSQPVMEGTHCKGVILETKSGRRYYGGKMFVDATGDADLLYRAGVPTVQMHDNQPTFVSNGADLESCKKAIDTQDIGMLLKHYYGTDSQMENNFQGTTFEDINRYVTMNHQAAIENIQQENRRMRDIYTIPLLPQFRKTRRIDGDYTLTEPDLFRHFDDAVSAMCDWTKGGSLYEIPYRTLVRTGFDNLITAGRTISSTGYMWEVTRVLGPVILTGQAAGTACALAIDQEKPIDRIEIAGLQENLAGQDVMIHFDDQWIPANLSLEKDVPSVKHSF